MQGLRFKKSIAVLAWGIGPLLCSTPAVNAASEVDRDAGPIAAKKPVTDANGNQPKQSPIKIDPVVREGTAHLDIDETTRSRYSYYTGHWWFYLGDGNWMISRNGKWSKYW